ncbi:MAG: HD domain-containing protein [Clostridia bacterium]
MGKMKRTNLEWDNYINYLIDAINGSKFMKRAENKPMSTPKTSLESHISTRSIHLRQSADIAKRIAEGLDLNANYIYAGMLMHDAGHPFSAHEGEEIFTCIGALFDTQYFHHNAKGVEVILSEDICGQAISKIPNIENNPELKQKLKDEFYYFLDVIISHDGEASRKEMNKQAVEYGSIKEAVYAKMRLANSENNYKFVAQTPEGMLAKYADVIAYLASDMQDGFRLGILNDFSDDYLELFGEMFSTEYSVTREQRIENGKHYINEIKSKNLRETRESIMQEKDEEIKREISNILTTLNQRKLDLFKSDPEELEKVLNEAKNTFTAKKKQEFWDRQPRAYSEEERQEFEKQLEHKAENDEDLTTMEEEFAEYLNSIYSKVNKIEEYAVKMLRVRSSVAREVTSKMQEFFISDLIKNSQESEVPQFSEATARMFFKAKELNYREFVQYTKWDYQITDLPKAALELVQKCAESLKKSGAIRNKFYDESIKAYITDPECLKYMKTKYRREQEYTTYKEENGIARLKSHATTHDCKWKNDKKQIAHKRLYKNVYQYVENEDQVFAIRYQNTYRAIINRVEKKIKIALSSESQSKNEFYQEQFQEQIDQIRQEIIEKYGTFDLTPEQKEEYIALKTEQDLANIEEKMAIQLSSDYLAGMTDRSFNDIALKTGYITQESLQNSVRGQSSSNTVQKLADAMAEER